MAGMQRTKGLNKSCFLLIVIAGIERFAFKGVASNLVTYLTDVVKLSNSAAAKTVNNWCGFTSMLPLLVASLADSCWDKHPTILASSYLYVVGLMALTSTALTWAWYPPNKRSSTFLYWSLGLISVGQGGYNPSLQAFGADQLESDDELPSTKDDRKSNKKSLFFQWWYFGVCGGSLLGVTVMSYIQDTFGWVLGFAIPTIAMISSIVIFCCGSRVYAYKQDLGDDKRHFRDMVQAIKELASKLGNCKIILPSGNSEVLELELQERPLCPDNSGSIKSLNSNPRSGTYLLENAKVVLRLVPIWTMLLMFAVIFQQPATFFTKQGVTMERSIGSKLKIPPATLQSSITVSIILLMPLYDTIFIPITRLITRDKKGINVMQRMGIGMVLSIIAMIIAAVVERKRIMISREMPHSETVPLSIFWLLPQYILLGISDIFTVVGMQEFFYNEVPVRMKTMGIALYTSVFGVGSFLSAFLISVIEAFTSSRGTKSWFTDDMREARLDNYYWLLAFLSALSMLFYVILCKFYSSSSGVDNQNSK
ncbi:protein NRT1/ PTR FAMILY 5.8 [Ricinus communis]|uniref:protein NRT1/ PTR FAMILY 5.8 n=1 Tax=Ricinus communis TaxID=3988 RepID=UPI00201B0280|nr:protein NRT1/ PTR FAMILY 5.8 [Ricinus communis]